MGLGLTIARDLVAAHGGELKVDSHPGQGSRFTILLPSP
jgi:signal transduction histidine kinase